MDIATILGLVLALGSIIGGPNPRGWAHRLDYAAHGLHHCDRGNVWRDLCAESAVGGH
jgi:hypothetical protein